MSLLHTMNFYTKTIINSKKKFIDNWLLISLSLILLNASYHFYKSSLYVRGLFLDYYVPKIYFNQLIFLIIILLFFSSLKTNKYILYVLVFILFNYFFSFKKQAFLIVISYKLIPLLYFFILNSNIYLLLKKNYYKKLIFVNIFLLIVFFLQFIFKESFFPYFPFGFYYYKGVSYNLDFISIHGSKYPIPLGMFPHPNVFAAYISFLNIFFVRKNKILFFINILLVVLLGSLSAIFFNILIFKLYTKKNNTFYLLIMFLFFYISFLLSYKSTSLTQRVLQYKSFVYLFLEKPFFGWGLGNYLLSIPFYEKIIGRVVKIQPIHNIFLLYLVEFGLFGLSLFFVFLYKLKYYLKITPFLIFILIFGLSDHFLYTLNQGFILLLLAFICHKLTIRNNKLCLN